MGEFLIYGATGYTGRLAAEHAVAIGLQPVLAGRSPDRLKPLAKRLGLEWRAFSLDTPSETRQGLKGMAAVLHAAGPFLRHVPTDGGRLHERGSALQRHHR